MDVTDHGDGGADLTEIIRQHVDKTVVMIDQQHPLAGAGRIRRQHRQRFRRIATQRLKQSCGLDLAFAVLGGGIRIEQAGGADPHLGKAVLHPDGADRQPGIDAAVEIHRTDRAGIPTPRRALIVLDELHRP